MARAVSRAATATRRSPSRPASVAKKPAVKKAPAKKPVAKKAPAKKPVAKKPVAKKPVAKKPIAKKPIAKKPVVKKAPAKKPVAKKPVVKKAPAKKPVAKKPVVKKAPAKKPVATKPIAKKAPEKKAPEKKANPAPIAKPKSESKVEPPKITLKVPTGAKRDRPSRPLPPLKPRSEGPKPLVVKAGEAPWTKAELAALRVELDADVLRLKRDLADAEHGIADLLRDSGDGAGDDQADAGNKTFEREHELSLVNNARDMLMQAERAIGRISDGSYGVCESCGSPIGKARLQVFPRATLCMLCKQKEERR